MSTTPTRGNVWHEMWQGWSLRILAGAVLLVIVVPLIAWTILLPEAGLDTTPTTSDAPVVPASGVEGFNVEPFCNDSLTRVRSFPAPDASGLTYQLTRVKDEKTESVTFVTGADGSSRVATHYYDTALGQQSEPAFVNGDARLCIEKKAR